MSKDSDCLIILGGSSQLGQELTKIAVENSTSVISIDHFSIPDLDLAHPQVTHLSHDLSQDFSFDSLREIIGDARAVSMVFVASGRKHLSDSNAFFQAWEVQVKSLEEWSRRFLEVLQALEVDGLFVLISSINGQLVSHSNPRYGAIKAAAESVISSYAMRANSLGRGAFLTLRLGYIENIATNDLSDWATIQAKAANELVGMKNLVTWRDVAMLLQNMVSGRFGILNGSLLYADHGVHLIEQTHATVIGERSRN